MKTIYPVPKLEELLNENGDLVYRQPYQRQVTIIPSAEIDRLLNGKPLNNTTVWEVIQAFEGGK
jgi:hypothetical protein